MTEQTVYTSAGTPRPRLDGAVVLVTGGGGELGSVVSTAAATLGAHVAVHALHPEKAEAVAAKIRQDGGVATSVAADVSDPDDVARMAEHVRQTLGPVNALVHCAARRGAHRPIHEIPPDEWEQVVAVALDGAFLCTQAVLPHMIERGYGRIVYLGGAASTTGRPVGSTHGASAKAGLEGLARSVAQEFRGQGVTTNVVTPAPLATSRATAAGHGALMSLDEAAAFILFLCDERSRTANGTVFNLGDSLLIG